MTPQEIVTILPSTSTKAAAFEERSMEGVEPQGGEVEEKWPIPTPLEYVIKARGYIGTKFHHQGRSPHGMDCIGLVVLPARDLGIELADWFRYSRYPQRDVMLERLSLCMDQVHCKNIPLGAIIFFYLQKPKAEEPILCHLAIKDEDDLILHTDERVNKVTKMRMDNGWRKAIDSVWQIRGLKWRA